jgi:hypothetical protein
MLVCFPTRRYTFDNLTRREVHEVSLEGISQLPPIRARFEKICDGLLVRNLSTAIQVCANRETMINRSRHTFLFFLKTADVNFYAIVNVVSKLVYLF